MQIFAKTLQGVTLTLQVTQNQSIASVIKKIAHKTGYTYDEIRLIYKGQQLQQGLTLSVYQIVKQQTIHIVRRLRGDIGIFDQHINTLCREYLINENNLVEKQNIYGLVQKLNGNQQSEYIVTQLQDKQKIDLLIKYVDEKFMEAVQKKLPKQEIQDFKINLTKQKLIQIVGQQIYERLQKLFEEKPNEIIIRRCQAHGKMINFHTDVSYKTLQLSLNNDEQYKGGKLLYAAKGNLVKPERVKGTITIHDKKIVHGVTLFQSGVRYGLFLLRK